MIEKWKSVLFITLVTLFAAKAANDSNVQRHAEPNKEIKLINYRLPMAITPSHYDLSLYFLPELPFRGSVRIKAIVQEKTNNVVLHYGKLNIKSTTVLHKMKELTLQSKDYDPITEKYSITLEKVLPKGTEIMIVIIYFGELQDDLKGFYKMDYFNKKGEAKKIAATQFSPIYARHAFPCFDEPAFKSFFKIRIQRPSNYIALSNMPLIKSTKATGGNYVDLFDESVKMSTYLVGFVIGDLTSKSNNRIKIWARQDVIDQTEYALTVSPEILKTLESFFDQPYQISKLDMVALPKMYFNAMENWGLITYRESALLYDKIDSSVAVKKAVTEVIAHECTHMWFGNLVTPNWWGFLWLKEAFAGYFEFRTVHAIEPTWKMDEHILLRQQNALLVDSLPSSSPLTRNVYSPSEVMGMFDRISYDKGLSILRMLDLSFGTKIFDAALASYLYSKKTNTGKPEDLFASIQIKINSNLDASVETIMNTWTRQSGYPVLSVTVHGNHVELRQNQFSLNKLNSNSSSDKKWWIPITWISESTISTTDKWINDDEIITVEKEKDDWIIFNTQAAGFYRVNYDTVSWYKIIEALNGKHFEKIPLLNRAAIIDDLLNLARANLLDYNIALEGLEYLKHETNYLPFKVAFNSLEFLARKFSILEFDIYSKYLLSLIKNIHLKVGFTDKNDKDMTNMLLRRELNLMSCNLGHQDCVNKSLLYFNNWKDGTNRRVPGNLKTVVYTTAIKKGGADNWYFLLDKYNDTNIVSEQMEISNALSCCPHSEILNKHLRSFLLKSNNHRIYGENLKDVFSSVSSCSLFGAETVIDFIDMHYKEILKFSGNNLEQIFNILSEVSQHLSTQTLVDKFELLIQSHSIDLKPIMSSLKSQLEFAKHELTWYHTWSKKIISWFQSDDKLVNSENLNYIISD